MDRAESIPIAVVGGGVIGLCVAINLAKKFGPNSVYLFERHDFLGEEQSSRNSGVMHSGIYYDPSSLKAELCVLGNRMLRDFCAEHSVPFAINGKLILAQDFEDEAVLDFYKLRGNLNGCKKIRILSKDEITNFEPNVTGSAALFVPSAGVIDASSYMKALEVIAEQTGVTILKGSNVCEIEAGSNGVYCRVEALGTTNPHYSFVADLLINASGLRAAALAKMINKDALYEMQPILGEYATFNRNKRKSIFVNGMHIYQTPKKVTKGEKDFFVVGVHLTPTFEFDSAGKSVIGRTVLVGPTGDAVSENHGYESRLHDLEYFLNETKAMLPGIRLSDLSLGYCGIRAKLKSPKDDFVIAKDLKYPNCINVMADSPGLTASLAIADYFISKVI